MDSLREVLEQKNGRVQWKCLRYGPCSFQPSHGAHY
jgi:hypothetical protein